jgi:adenylate cyclase
MPVSRASSLSTPEKRLDYHFPLTARIDILNKFLVIIIFLWDNCDGSNRHNFFGTSLTRWTNWLRPYQVGELMEHSKPSFQIDLDEFKLHIPLGSRIQRTLHFDSPSRRFYLSVIALVLQEMKKRGKIQSIPLLQHINLLALMNESIGGAAGSSDKENLLPRIYRKWKGALPNLEEAPLFRVLGKKREDADGIGSKVYSFTEVEKDAWANLFEYTGSNENVRLRLAIDKVGVSLNDTSIIFENSSNGDAWDRFISSLKKDEAGTPEVPASAETSTVPEEPPLPTSVTSWGELTRLAQNRWAVLVLSIGIIAGVWGIWRAYLSPRIQVASVNQIPDSLPDKPSIAVLPFTNLSEDPEQEYFSDGITEDIITHLAELPRLFVVSSNSSFLYKGKRFKIEDIARDLRVGYFLEGNVCRAGSRVRITAKLIACKTGKHIWADTYDRELKDIFAVQDEVTRKVVSEISLALTANESEYAYRKYTQNFDAYDLYLRARAESQLLTRENSLKAMELSKEVITLDPKFAGGYASLSWLLSRSIRAGWSDSPHEDLKKALELAKKAISIDDKFPRSYMALASVYLMQDKHEDALVAANRAVTIAPGDSTTMLYLGYYLHWVGRGAEGVAAIRKSMELNPMYLSGRNPTYLDWMGMVCFTAGLYEESILNSKKAIEKFGSFGSRDPFLIASYSKLGRTEEARDAVQQWLKVNPAFSLSSWNYPNIYKRPEDRERLLGALRKAGLK